MVNWNKLSEQIYWTHIYMYILDTTSESMQNLFYIPLPSTNGWNHFPLVVKMYSSCMYLLHC